MNDRPPYLHVAGGGLDDFAGLVNLPGGFDKVRPEFAVGGEGGDDGGWGNV